MDAFRHCYWSALLSREIGYIDALLFTNAHENYDENPPEEKRMDLYNNRIGLEIGRSHIALNFWPGATWMKHDTALANKCNQALEDGLLIEGLRLNPRVKKAY